MHAIDVGDGDAESSCSVTPDRQPRLTPYILPMGVCVAHYRRPDAASSAEEVKVLASVEAGIA